LIIGFSGLARSGKNEASNALLDYNFNVVAFADKLKEFLWNVNPYMRNAADNTYLCLQEVHKRYGGWEGMKNSPYHNCYRQLMQNIGTEAGRGVLGSHIWIDALDHKLTVSKNYAITDIRFPNEEEYVRSRGGITIRIERPGLQKVNEHASEQLSFESHYVILNNGSIEELHKKVANIYERHEND